MTRAMGGHGGSKTIKQFSRASLARFQLRLGTQNFDAIVYAHSETQGSRISYDDTGKGQPAVFLQAAGCATWRVFQPLLPLIANDGRW
jgi:hypothetical protein